MNDVAHALTRHDVLDNVIRYDRKAIRIIPFQLSKIFHIALNVLRDLKVEFKLEEL